MKQYIQCPDELVKVQPKDTVIFLAGGITGCENWQQDVYDNVYCANSGAMDNIILVNPRRQGFDVDNVYDSVAQIEWEHRHLNMADEVYFWFPKSGLCIITMFELGWALGSKKKVRVGCHPEYCRAFDVKEQIKNKAPWVTVVPSLEELFAPLKD